MTGGISWSQARGQQTSGVTLEDQHGVIHVLAITAVEEAELLLAMSGIVGGIDVEQNLPTLADLVAAEADELLAQPVVAAHQIAATICNMGSWRKRSASLASSYPATIW